MAQSARPSTQRIGRGLVTGMPKLLAVLSVVGTAAMVWVGGHILLVGADELGWHGPYDLVHRLEDPVHDVAGIGGVLAWLVNTLASAIVGLAVGTLVVVLVGAREGGPPASAGRRATTDRSPPDVHVDGDASGSQALRASRATDQVLPIVCGEVDLERGDQLRAHRTFPTPSCVVVAQRRALDGRFDDVLDERSRWWWA